jgi:hypothetical protein
VTGPARPRPSLAAKTPRDEDDDDDDDREQ